MRSVSAWIRWRRCLQSRSHPGYEAQWLLRRPSAVQTRRCTCSAPTPPRRHKSTVAVQPTPTTTPDPPTPAADHRTLGAAQELFINSPYSPGSPLFLPNGTRIINRLTNFLRQQYLKYGFKEVITPTIYKKSLWETSGHWGNYKDDMYQVSGRGASGQAGETGEDEVYGLKPMNCPGHCLIFRAHRHSYRDLPIRYADFSALHRNEVSGSLSGLTRVRRFHQDDGHIFCRPDQIMEEISRTLDFVQMSMKVFHFDQYKLVLSTRPEKDFIGSPEEWEEAESQLRTALDQSGKQWELNPGDGAFYGPKIDIILRDSDGKDHQTATIQLDFQLPQRFGLEYDVGDGVDAPSSSSKATPVLIHRAVFGSLERYFALLIEHYGGWWPFWLSPRKCIVLTVNQDKAVRDYVSSVRKLAAPEGSPLDDPTTAERSAVVSSYIEVDDSPRSLGKKLAEAKKKRYNLIMTVGPQNVRDGTVDIDFEGQARWKVHGEDIEAILKGKRFNLKPRSLAPNKPEMVDLKRVSFPADSVGRLLTLLDLADT
jgi:threonyl-tRNA synthetase